MNQNQINIDNSRLIIKVDKSPLIIRIILSLILVVSFLIPFIAIFISINYTEGLQFGIIITFLIFWGIGFYILRVVLWNGYGKEILTLNSEKVSYIADYKLFRDGYQELDTKNLSVNIIVDSNSSESKGYLKLQNKKDFIETNLKTRQSDLNLLKFEIEKRYNIT
ncbi:hypothetical protein [Marivirga sp.]|uniref:hypothetical protein n=1 Tax=Marivirga sp. TaxID=2018662 RepID=UPI003DA6D9E6